MKEVKEVNEKTATCAPQRSEKICGLCWARKTQEKSRRASGLALRYMITERGLSSARPLQRDTRVSRRGSKI
jgi:hypothetical protein